MHAQIDLVQFKDRVYHSVSFSLVIGCFVCLN
jgi:hypothetical protein